jgi:hypothetical protein
MERAKKILYFLKKKVAPYFIILLSTFFLSELVFLIGGNYTGHSVELFGKYHIHTGYPISYWDSCFATYSDPALIKSPKAYGQYDTDLGWSIAPNKTGKHGLYRSNSQGIRADKDYSEKPDTGVIRIAVFGDSFTHGNEVDNTETWPAQLEKLLIEAGYNVEVLNFGVMSYGTDQAYLHWERDGKPFQPHIVLMGIQAENIFRNVNVFRPCYIPNAGITLSKPRAINKNGKLKWVNQPTIPPNKLRSVVKDFENSALAEYEYFKDVRLLKNGWIDWSYTLIVMRHLMSSENQNRTDIGGFQKGLLLHEKILQAFSASVKQTTAKFLAVQLPTSTDLKQYRKKGELDYSDHLYELAAQFPLIRTEKAFDDEPLKDLFQPHYTPKGNAIIAETIANELEKEGVLSLGPRITRHQLKLDVETNMPSDSVGTVEVILTH